ncbi:rho GTPase-activating protein 23-like [Plakobranchus ocellatus]|uniref:Rho GTPase-activating protein 23-like n=1 Tax=Plakobranchus ocellatus TaxID=259542 RepID=A0AAV4E1L6_9GAST|nr:rho GTPase-activating protein 23-like [Plakobranchus ocellatus]
MDSKVQAGISSTRSYSSSQSRPSPIGAASTASSDPRSNTTFSDPVDFGASAHLPPNSSSLDWEGPHTVVIPRGPSGFGFTLRHLVVYPPQSVPDDDDDDYTDGDGDLKQTALRKLMLSSVSFSRFAPFLVFTTRGEMQWGAVAHLIGQLATKSEVQGSNLSPGEINLSYYHIFKST